MLILGIETSCDETSIALVETNARGFTQTKRGLARKGTSSPLKGGGAGGVPPRFRVLQNLVSSQIKVHAPFGGVVPNLAKREHTKNLPVLFRKVFGKERRANGKRYEAPPSPLPPLKRGEDRGVLPAIDMIAVTVGPGLEPALWTGIEFAKTLTADLRGLNADGRRRGQRLSASVRRLSTPVLVGANHLEGHLYSFLLPKRTPPSPSPRLRGGLGGVFPAVHLIVSGGHTILLLVQGLTKWKKLGETRDDAVGEAFDKVARIMGLPYPGGPEIEELAHHSSLTTQNCIPFPRPMLNQKNYDFSFSGLKTAVLYYLREHGSRIHADITRISADRAHRRTSASNPRQSAFAADVAASFQHAAIDVLVQKTIRAAREYGAKSVMLSGGVAANKALRRALAREAKKIGAMFIAPEAEYNTDNAAMIAVAGYVAHLRKKRYKLEAQGSLSI